MPDTTATPEDSNHGEGAQVVARRPPAMNRFVRWLLGLLALVLLAVASWGVLHEDNELGTVALALIGAVFVTIAGMGRWPSKLTWGDKQAEWLEEVLETTLTKASPETRDEVLGIARRQASSLEELLLLSRLLDDEPPRRTAPSEAIHRLSRQVPHGAVLTAEASGGGRRVDAHIAPKGERSFAKSVAVEFLSSEQDSPREALDAAMRLLDLGFGAVLLVSAHPERLVWSGEIDDSTLRRIFITGTSSDDVTTNVIADALAAVSGS
jgi:hypothetical protein